MDNPHKGVANRVEAAICIMDRLSSPRCTVHRNGIFMPDPGHAASPRLQNGHFGVEIASVDRLPGRKKDVTNLY